MPRRTSQPPPLRTRPTGNNKSNEKKISLVSFVIHSFNRLRGKPNTDYQDVLMQRQPIEARNPWKAVEVVPDYKGCIASKSLNGKRFLCDEAPTLPLPGCTAATCHCRYKHHTDRRAGPRRAEDMGIHIHLTASPPSNRRFNRGRRSDDQ